MGEIHLIRHGQASFGAQNYDCLSALGIQQSQRLGVWWRQQQVQFDAIYSGERERQKDTAIHAFTAGGEPHPAQRLQIDPAFNELDADRLMQYAVPRIILQKPELMPMLLDLKTHREPFRRLFEQLVDEWVAGQWQDAGIGDWAGFSGRVHAGLQAIVRQQGPGRRIAVFTSGGPITALLQRFGEARAGGLDWDIANTSITRIHYDADGNFRLADTRQLPHLLTEQALISHL